eukprot:TRINITY_DN14456_c0_g1_i1.p1 TRINITY_DN14456_c0_g1~~TRINITY_DN14456_c0_g1_i1.p1  ORF type:complete len:214 (+),score=22.47 TRINITY_DN14456_c0_g1_i1:85-642(+)
MYLSLASDSCFALCKQDLPANLQAECPDLAADAAVCFFMLLDRRHRKPLGFIEMAVNGLLQLPFLFGFSCVRRLLRVLDAEKKEAKSLWGSDVADKSITTYYLQNMVVHPKMQGRGIGSACLRKALNDLRSKHGGRRVRVTLTTQKEENVRFYHRLGFETIRDVKYMDKSTDSLAYHNWFMDLLL